jgi:hypothetical protein
MRRLCLTRADVSKMFYGTVLISGEPETVGVRIRRVIVRKGEYEDNGVFFKTTHTISMSEFLEEKRRDGFWSELLRDLRGRK